MRIVIGILVAGVLLAASDIKFVREKNQEKLIFRKVEPACPSSVKTGTKTEVILLIDDKGWVHSIVVDPRAQPPVRNAIEAALAKWQYAPTVKDGEGIWIHTKVHVVFHCP